MPSFETILVPTDFSPCSAQAFGYALLLARRYAAHVHLLHVTDESAGPPASRDHAAPPDEQLHAFLASFDLADVSVEHHITYREDVTEGVLDHAVDVEADLLVLGTHGRRGLKRLVLGSVAEATLRRAPCPALAVRQQAEEHPPSPPQRILLPLDLSAPSQAALPYAKELAAAFGARLHLLHVVEDVPLPPAYGTVPTSAPSPEADVEQRARQILQQIADEASGPDLTVEAHLGAGIVPAEILNVVEEEHIDLIVMASHGRTGLARVLMGSVTEDVLRKAPCPVFVARSFEPSEA